MQTTGPRTRRAALIGFAVGFVMAFVVTVLALMSTLFERLEDVLVPGALLLSPLSERMAGWNGLLNMVLAGVANGLLYALVVATVAAVLRHLRAD
jgi:tetrahydromethanopterin S-methyltransferase subunit F